MQRGEIYNNYENLYTLAQTIGEQICSRLNLKMVYKAKLEKVRLSIHDGKETNCLLINLSENELIAFFIFNENDLKDETWIAFCFAHELAHLLFTRFDYLGDFCESDETYAYTNVQRSSNGERYGVALEELLCDYIAIDIVSKVENKTKAEVKEHLISKYNKRVNQKNLDLTEKILSMFSQAPLEDDDFYDEIIVDEDGIMQKNLLLYEAVHGYDMSSLVTDYDRAMGSGAWKRLNHFLDKYFFEESQMDFSQIENELYMFSFRYQSESDNSNLDSNY